MKQMQYVGPERHLHGCVALVKVLGEETVQAQFTDRVKLGKTCLWKHWHCFPIGHFQEIKYGQ